jgi:hypothetical protein
MGFVESEGTYRLLPGSGWEAQALPSVVAAAAMAPDLTGERTAVPHAA